MVTALRDHGGVLSQPVPDFCVPCAGNNPYSIIVVPENTGDWQKTDVIVGNWNSPDNTNFGMQKL